jgi:hypothetical protein
MELSLYDRRGQGAGRGDRGACLALTYRSWSLAALALGCLAVAVMNAEIEARIRRDDEEFRDRFPRR